MQAQALKITTIGNSLGVILPKELLSHLRLAKGDSLFVTPSKDGITGTSYDPDIEAEIAMGQAFMNEYRETFKVLAQ
jgi:putative addiction module antidote